jgi:hypothetical protein
VRKGMGILVLVPLMLTGSAAARNSTPVVEARTVLAAEGGAPGTTLKAAAVAQVASGFHINDHKPTLDYLIPTEWVLESTKQIRVEKVIYPKGQPKKFAFSDSELSVYEGALTVGALLKIGRTVKPGNYTLKGDFKYQACNDHACLPPKTLPLALTVKVVRQGTAVKTVNSEVFRNVRFD